MKKFYFFIILLTLEATVSFSQPGTLDASFGTGGKIVTATGDSSSVANSVVVISEGKMLVGGTSFIAGKSVATLLQYNSDGTIDSTFGIQGKASLPPTYESSIFSIALQPDGKIIAGGYIRVDSSIAHTRNFLIVRYNKQGNPDSTFGDNGLVSTAYNFFGTPGDLNIKKLMLKPDGKIVAGGTVNTFTFEAIPVLAQYLPGGTLDSSFGTNGTTTKGIYFLGGVMDAVNDLAVTTDNKILAVLNEYPMGSIDHTDFAIYKLLSNGNNDSTFGNNGVVRTDIDSISGDDAYSTVVLPDNSFVVAGYSYKYIYYPATNTYYSATSIALAKYHPDGSLDSTFGANGKVHTLALPDITAYSNHILLSPDGSFIVSGYTFSASRDFLLAKYHPNGTLDSSFGTNGVITTDFSGTNDVSYSSALQTDGKIVLVGSTGTSVNYNIALARYGNVILPLRLLSFTAVKSGNANLLQWQTAQEINTRIYEVQRSADGKNYSTIGYVNTGSNAYHFTDDKPSKSNNYYRLKMIDLNGIFIYSPVRIINSSLLTVKIFPNPSTTNLYVQVSNGRDVSVTWQIISINGRVLMSGQWVAQVGNSIKKINIAALSKGSYYLVTVEKNTEQRTTRFEKL